MFVFSAETSAKKDDRQASSNRPKDDVADKKDDKEKDSKNGKKEVPEPSKTEQGVNCGSRKLGLKIVQGKKVESNKFQKSNGQMCKCI